MNPTGHGPEIHYPGRTRTFWTLDEKQLQNNHVLSVAKYGDGDAQINRRTMLEPSSGAGTRCFGTLTLIHRWLGSMSSFPILVVYLIGHSGCAGSRITHDTCNIFLA